MGKFSNFDSFPPADVGPYYPVFPLISSFLPSVSQGGFEDRIGAVPHTEGGDPGEIRPGCH